MLLIPVNLAYQMVARTGFVGDDSLSNMDYEKFMAERGKNKVDDGRFLIGQKIIHTPALH